MRILPAISFHRILPAMLALFVCQASAAVIAEFNFNSSNLLSSDNELNTTAGSISSGAGITGGTDIAANSGSGGSPSIQIRYDDMYPANNGNKTLADAIADDIYYSFTITPLAGQSIDFTSFTAFTDKNGGGATFGYYLMSDIGGFTDGAQIASSEGNGSGVTNINLDVSSLTGVTSATEFRLYIRTNNFSTGGNFLELDDIILNGTVTAIPEPSAALLGGFGALLLLRRRRA